jgi:hypothetical protein
MSLGSMRLELMAKGTMRSLDEERVKFLWAVKLDVGWLVSTLAN